MWFAISERHQICNCCSLGQATAYCYLSITCSCLSSCSEVVQPALQGVFFGVLSEREGFVAYTFTC
eukprot:1161224-Pelagomonas_calceolata.AAC.4